jgi:uncharacterized protein (DUF305 family)
MRIRTFIATAAFPVALLGAACGGDDDTSNDEASATTTETEGSEEHNDADVEFAQMMIPHHRQAAEMAALAPDRAESPEIRDLADTVIATQEAEIDQMAGWLEEWGEDVPPEADPGGMGMDESSTTAMDHDMADTTMADDGGGGMMSPEDMSALEAATGPEFDRMFAEMMIEHHRGAIEMANEQVESGEFADAIDLAEAIVTTQEAEIADLEAFLSAQ